MLKAYIKLHNIEEIVELQKIANECEYELILRGKCDYNPKSLLNMFTVPTNKVLTLFAKTDDKNDFSDKFGKFLNRDDT